MAGPSARGVPLATDRRALVRAAATLVASAVVLVVLVLSLHRLLGGEPGYRPAGWLVALRAAFVVPPLLLFTVVMAGVARVPGRMRLGAVASTFGLTLWMTFELVSVLYLAPGSRGVTVELGIDALVVAGITAYLYGGLLEHRRLVHRAERDALTGLLNRAGAARAWETVPRGALVTLAVVDLNELKLVNDREGHEAGDALLLACAAALEDVCGGEGVAARWGGDEFLLAVPGRSPEALRERLERVAEGIAVGAGELPVWAVGTTVAVAGDALSDAMQPADADMYRHKAEQYLAADPRPGRPPGLPRAAGAGRRGARAG